MTAGGEPPEGSGPPETGPGAVVAASWWGTAAFTASALAAVLIGGAAEVVAFAVSVGLFLAGWAAFVLAYGRAVSRSRRDEISVVGLFFLAGGSAPPPVRRRLLGSLGVQTVVAIAAAAIRPYTSLAAGTLVPIYGLALCGLWSARYGSFPARRRPSKPARGSAQS